MHIWQLAETTHARFRWRENLNVVIVGQAKFNFDFREKPTFTQERSFQLKIKLFRTHSYTVTSMTRIEFE